MCAVFDGVNDSIGTLQVNGPGYPFGFTAWIKVHVLTQVNMGMMLLGSGDTARDLIKLNNNFVVHDAYDGVTNPQPQAGPITADAWTSIVVRTVNATDREISVNGGTFVSSGTSCNPGLTPFCNLGFGGMWRASDGFLNFAAFRLGPWSVHGVTLTQQNAIDHAAGKHFMRFGNVGYAAMMVNDASLYAGFGPLTVNGGLVFDNTDNPTMEAWPPSGGGSSGKPSRQLSRTRVCA